MPLQIKCWNNVRVVDRFVRELDREDREDPTLEAEKIFSPDCKADLPDEEAIGDLDDI